MLQWYFPLQSKYAFSGVCGGVSTSQRQCVLERERDEGMEGVAAGI